MNNKIDPCDTMRVNLIAAAVGLQQCTKTDSNIVHVPGGDRVIAIGTPAQVRALLAEEVDERCPHCDGTGDVHRSDGTWAGTCTCPAGAARPATDAGEIRGAQPCSVQGCTAPAESNSVGACAVHLGEFKTWSVAQAGADLVDSEGGHHD